MISLEQVRILEQKVGGVVSKLEELNAENQALRQKCEQLEQDNSSLRQSLSSFEQDQIKIEQGIINALDRLNTVENSVLLAAGVFQQESRAAAPSGAQEQATPGSENDGDPYAQAGDTAAESAQRDEPPQERQSDSGFLFSGQSEQVQPGAFDIF